MMTKYRALIHALIALFLTLVCAFLVTARAEASPAAPVEIEITQPDGKTTFMAHQWGDEWNNGFETGDGFSILRLGNGWWAYAGLRADGKLNPALLNGQPLLVGIDAPDGLELHLRAFELRDNPHSAGNLEMELPDVESPTAPLATSYKTLVLLAKFTDQQESYSAASFQELMFSTTSSSVRDYFQEISYTNLDIIPASETCGTANDGITEWTNLGRVHPDPGIITDERNQQIVKDVLIANNGCINFASFDTNLNGFIDTEELVIVVVVAGFEQAAGAQTPSVWAHSWSLDEISPPVLDGMVVGNSLYGGYAQFGEQQVDHQATIGVMAHEFGHVVGWPDLYDIDYSSSGVGDWSLMGYGAWNQTTLAGDSPAHADAFLKWYQGWLNPTAVNLTMSDVEIPQVEDNPVVYLLRLNPKGIDWRYGSRSGRGEYFLVEYRQKTLYDTGLPGCGLLYWHIDESVTHTINANADEDHPLIALMQAESYNELYYGINNGDASDPWPGDTNHFSFNVDTTPNSKLYSGDDSFVSIRIEVTGCPTTMRTNLTYAPTAPGTFAKLSPVNLSTGWSTRLTLDWEDASEAAEYAVCYDDVVNGTCTGSWTSTADLSQATLSGLATKHSYEWHVSATNTGGTTYSDLGAPFSFTTGDTSYNNITSVSLAMAAETAPADFSKSYPASGATGISTHPTIDWNDAGRAVSYEFCYDLVIDGECKGGWNSTGTTSQITLSGLPYSTTYEWQARAINSGGITEADSGGEWSFSTQPAISPWTTIANEDFEVAIPKAGWSRYDYSSADGGEYFIGQRPCNVNAGSNSGWLIGGGEQGGALGCNTSYLANHNSWFIYGPFSTVNATAGQLNFNFYVNSEAIVDTFAVLATDDYTGTWGGLFRSGSYPWQSTSFDLGQPLCGGGYDSCLGQLEVYVAFSFESDEQNQMVYGAIIDNIVLRLCNAGSCSGGAPPFEAISPFQSEAIGDFLQPFLEQFQLPGFKWLTP
jgi:immune inhibitor A